MEEEVHSEASTFFVGACVVQYPSTNPFAFDLLRDGGGLELPDDSKSADAAVSVSTKVVELDGGPPWGFRTHGGRDTNVPFKIIRVNPGSKAAKGGIREGDLVTAINGETVSHLTNGEVQKILKQSGPSITLELKSSRKATAPEAGTLASGAGEASEGDHTIVVTAATLSGSDRASGSVSSTLYVANSVEQAPGAPAAQPTSSAEPTTGEKRQETSGASTKTRKSHKKKVEDFNERGVDVCDAASAKGPAAITENNNTEQTVQPRCRRCGSVGGGGYRNMQRSACRSRWTDKMLQRHSMLGEIISELDELLGQPFFNDADFKNKKTGVWTPGKGNTGDREPPKDRSVNQVSREPSSPKTVDNSSTKSAREGTGEPQLPQLIEEAAPPIWAPSSVPSPSTQRKFRPVNFNSPTSPSSADPTVVALEHTASAGQVPEETSAVPSDTSGERRKPVSSVEFTSLHTEQRLPNHSNQSQSVHLPKYQSPTVTLLQKAREGQLPKGAHYLDEYRFPPPAVQRSTSASGGFSSSLSRGPGSGHHLSLNPNDTLYELKSESVRASPTGQVSRRAEFTPKRYDGSGPTTSDGVPIALKTGTNNGHEWYRRMYESLHVDNKARRKVPSASGYLSEPEGYDSDAYASRYQTLDRRKIRDRAASEAEYLYPCSNPPPVIPSSIRFTPGRIEDYTPGNSSFKAKEIRRHKPTLQWALGSKDLGYESDSNLVIRKRAENQETPTPPPPPLSPAEQRQVYVEIQKGGEVPLQGLRKPAPEKPKVMSPLPTFEDVKRSLLNKARPGSPSSFRSGSPSLLYATNSKVSLLQERIQSKLRRANSDLSSTSNLPYRSRTDFFHRSTTPSTSRGSGPASFIPLPSRNPSMEKLRVSSPELTSPREVKKVLETSHQVAIKFEVTKVIPATRSMSVVGVKKVMSGEKIMRKITKTNKSGRIKMVKIAEHASIAPAAGPQLTLTQPESSTSGVPAKPPRKSAKSSVRIESKLEKPPKDQGRYLKPGKVSAVASRHAGCLSPHASRPTSPGGASSSGAIPTPPKMMPNLVPGTGNKVSAVADRKKSTTILKSGQTTPVGKSPRSSVRVKEEQKDRSSRSTSVRSSPCISAANSLTRLSSPVVRSAVSKSRESLVSTASRSSVKKRQGRQTIENVTTMSSYSLNAAESFDSTLYLTIPPRKGAGDHHIIDVWTMDDRRIRSVSWSPGCRSLPALTPYLKETKRVSNSAFVIKANNASILRERAALAKRLDLDEKENQTRKAILKRKQSPSPAAKKTVTLLEKKSTESLKSPTSSAPVSRSVSCLGLRRSTDYTYQKYIMELQHSRRRCPRFMQLHRLYSSLERLGQLERSTSMYDIPVTSPEKQLHFESWWKVRNRNRVDEEIANISYHLSEAQRNREFFYRPRKVEDYKWKGDSGLRCKQWSVDELRSILMGEYDDRLYYKSAQDLHKTAWRATSVKEQALTMEVNALSKAGFTLTENNRIYGGPWLRRAFSMSSTLSEEQRENIKSRLVNLFKPDKMGTIGERVSRPPERRVVTTRRGITMSSDRPMQDLHRPSSSQSNVGLDGCLTEAAKKQLSRSLSYEIRERKVQERKKLSSQESESGKSSDDSMRTVIHVPVSTKVMMRKMEKEKSFQKNKVPAYSVYCSQKVPSKVNYFESQKRVPEKEARPVAVPRVKLDSNTLPRQTSSVVKTHQTSSSVKAAIPTAVQVVRQRPISPYRRARSASPGPSGRCSPTLSYASHVNVISRLASLLLKRDAALKKLVTREVRERERLERLRMINAGEVDRLKFFFETQDPNDDEYRQIDLLRCLFCSDPNLARFTDYRSDQQASDNRRCASADPCRPRDSVDKENIDVALSRSKSPQVDRKPDGQESSPVSCASPDIYFNSRSRKPIYQPSTTPNVCQPTLTAHCFLEPPNKSLEQLNQVHPHLGSNYSSDFSGGYWNYYSQSASESIAATSPSPPYGSLPRVLDSRLGGHTSASAKNWNVDPALHQPKFRYVPPVPRSSMHTLAPPIPPAPNTLQYRVQHQPQYLATRDLIRTEKLNAATGTTTSSTAAIETERYWKPRSRSRDKHTRPVAPYRNLQETTKARSSPRSPVNLPRFPGPGSALRRSVSLSGASSPSEVNRLQERIRTNSGDTFEDVVSGSDQDLYPDSPDGKRQVETPHIKNTESGSKVASSSSLPSPLKYSESAVNIHYKAPIRLVEKEYISEDELRRRQQYAMKRYYEEQRQRKFLAEIQDMENRRHTDNFTPSQKSPIPLNRYEDGLDEPSRPRWRDRTPDKKVVARALYTFVPQNSRELSFQKGDILYIRRQLDTNWYEGEHNAAVGIFPSSYVEILPGYADRGIQRIQSEGQARVCFNFTAASPVEMSIVKGEVLVLTRRVDDNWYEGRIGSRRGIFPCSYVEVLKEPGTSENSFSARSSLSPKPIGSPAAHSLATQHANNFRHNYKPNDYGLTSDYNSIPMRQNSPPVQVPNNYSNREGYVLGRATTPSGLSNRAQVYSPTLTIDTSRMDPLSYKAIYNYKPANEDELELRENDVVHVLEKCDDGWYVGTSTRTGQFGTFPGNYVERVFSN